MITFNADRMIIYVHPYGEGGDGVAGKTKEDSADVHMKKDDNEDAYGADDVDYADDADDVGDADDVPYEDEHGDHNEYSHEDILRADAFLGKYAFDL